MPMSNSNIYDLSKYPSVVAIHAKVVLLDFPLSTKEDEEKIRKRFREAIDKYPCLSTRLAVEENICNIHINHEEKNDIKQIEKFIKYLQGENINTIDTKEQNIKILCLACSSIYIVKNIDVKNIVLNGKTFLCDDNRKVISCPYCRKDNNIKIFGAEHIKLADSENAFLSNIQYYEYQLTLEKNKDINSEKVERLERDITLEKAYLNAFKSKPKIINASA